MNSFGDHLGRRVQVTRQLALYGASPSLYPRSPAIPFYWYSVVRNFGDLMTPWLFQRYGIMAVHRRPQFAAAAGIGSIIEHLPADWRGTLVGSGMMFDRPVKLAHATAYAVRGELTRDHLGVPSTVALGDPGLLVSRHVTRSKRRAMLGVVAHMHHQNDPLFLKLIEADPSQVLFIDVADRPSRVVRQISGCDAIITSSLHGLVTADSFGIPALWTLLEPRLEGGDFKFRDHESVARPSSSRQIQLDGTETCKGLVRGAISADPIAVARAIRNLEKAIVTFRRDMAVFEQPPMLAFRALKESQRYGGEGNQWPATAEDIP